MPHDPLVLELHNSAKRRRCFIVATGPSLLQQMHLLPLLKDEDTFSVNGLPRWKALPFTPTYHGVTDIPHSAVQSKFVFPEMGPEVLRFNVAWPGWEHADGFTYVEKAAEHIQMQTYGFAGLNDDLPPLPTGRTTPLTLAQLAAWFGYEELYFLGFDLSRGYVDRPEATEGNSGRPFQIDDNPRIIQSIQRCATKMVEYLHAAGRQVYDCSPGGFLNDSNTRMPRGLRPIPIIPYRPLADVLQRRN